MKNKGLTLTVVCELGSGNYGEGSSNYAGLKKLTRGDSKTYSYISRQAIRYSIINQLRWDKETPVSDADTVVQFAKDASIEDYPEIDLFGYMKTGGNSFNGSANTRNAVVRLSNAIALEAYRSNLDFLNNMGIAKRKLGLRNEIAQIEIHKSYYSYTLTVDLDKVGIDTVALDKNKAKDAKVENIEIPKKDRADRVNKLLTVVKTLYRDIRGRRENLSPIFVIGGVYAIKNPFFENGIKLIENTLNLDVTRISNIINDLDKEVKENTVCGYMGNMFTNSDDIISKLNPKTIGETFDILCKKVDEYYGQ